MSAEDTLIELQADIKARLEADSYFEDIPVFLETDKAIDGDIKHVLGAMTAKAGKRGLAVVVEEPTGDDDFPNVHNGPLMIQWPVLVLELVPTNRSTTTGGTGKPALAAARRVHRVLKHFKPGGIANALVPGKPTIQPVAIDSILVLYRVLFQAQEANEEVETRVMVPRVGRQGANVAISTQTPDATIWYTTDGSHPWSGNTAATQYAAPFPADPNTRVRAAGYKATLIASNVTQLIV